jgi:dTDP-glucose 4,6-dehydratase
MSAPLPPLPAGDLDHVLGHTVRLWADARGARFFITGGTGFFGTWLLESFVRANDALGLDMRAVVLTRNPDAFARRSPHLAGRRDFEFLRGDLESFPFPSGRFTHLINSAAETGVWTSQESAAGLLDRITRGMTRLTEFATAAGVSRFLHVGSGAVYGPAPAGVTHLPENHPCQHAPLPAGASWAEGKRLEESLVQAYATKTGCVLTIARGFAFVGPHLPLNATFAIGNFLGDALRGGPVRVAGDGTPRRSYLYAADLAIWLWTLHLSAHARGVYNVGSDDARPIAAHAQEVARIAGLTQPVQIAQVPDPARPASWYVPDIGRARTELGLDVWISEEEAIRRTLAWHRAAGGEISSQKPGGTGS